MSQTKSGVRWTIQDIEAMPDNEWIRYEIIDGELFATRSPHCQHQKITGRILPFSINGQPSTIEVKRLSCRV